MSISLITLSQNTRLPNLFLLKNMILEQTYFSKITQWVIIDGSKQQTTEVKNSVDELRKTINIPITYIPHETGAKIGKLRNKANAAALGDIIICMDDDDYYPPTRVQEAWDELTNSDWLIAGVTQSCMYDFTFDKQYKMMPVSDYHSPNHAMAYKREYLTNHKHDETVSNNEEESFTNRFTEPLIQLISEKTVVVSSHSKNTYNKRPLIVNFYKGRFPKMYEYNVPIIPKSYHQKMKNIFTEENTIYDIVYFCGETVAWTPTDEGLGGSEQAVRFISEEWAKMGKRVAVYGNVPQVTHNKVNYFSWTTFPYNNNFKMLVVWRLPGMFFLAGVHPVKAEKIYLDLHDNAQLYNEFSREFMKFEKTVKPFDKIMFKSEYHLECFEKYINGGRKLIEDKYLIIPNGIRMKNFSTLEETRDPLRFCYCSSYSRGLDNILKCVWPTIVEKNPRAELHLYYGMNLETDKQKSYLTSLIAQSKNVMDHGRQPLPLIVREKKRATYQLYFNNSEFEIDCINIREGLHCGCIPIIFDGLVYAERDGIKIGKVDFFTKDTIKLTLDLKQVGEKIGNMINEIKGEEVEEMRQMLAKSQLLFDWKFAAEAWIKEKSYIPRNPINCCPNIAKYTSKAISNQ
jgi:glycosyltransferase involved in cell wall biosynthesis